MGGRKYGQTLVFGLNETRKTLRLREICSLSNNFDVTIISTGGQRNTIQLTSLKREAS